MVRAVVRLMQVKEEAGAKEGLIAGEHGFLEGLILGELGEDKLLEFLDRFFGDGTAGGAVDEAAAQAGRKVLGVVPPGDVTWWIERAE